MSLSKSLIAELKSEAAKTRKMLERVPIEKNDWKPHEKSMSLGRLSTHVAEVTSWVVKTMDAPELDFAKEVYKPVVANSTVELLKIHDDNVAKAIASLETASDDEFNNNWTLRNGEQKYFELPRKVVLRDYSYNHLYHHRGQLSVYLRLLDVPIPGMYGPTADER
ncbi:MAG: DinB family protein [Bacteroidota bacterium]